MRPPLLFSPGRLTPACLSRCYPSGRGGNSPLRGGAIPHSASSPAVIICPVGVPAPDGGAIVKLVGELAETVSGANLPHSSEKIAPVIVPPNFCRAPRKIVRTIVGLDLCGERQKIALVISSTNFCAIIRKLVSAIGPTNLLQISQKIVITVLSTKFLRTLQKLTPTILLTNLL